jgi:hypothetical protein
MRLIGFAVSVQPRRAEGLAPTASAVLTWVDVSLRGGQDWWEEILHRIADSYVFIAIVSEAALNSTAIRCAACWPARRGSPSV